MKTSNSVIFTEMVKSCCIYAKVQVSMKVSPNLTQRNLLKKIFKNIALQHTVSNKISIFQHLFLIQTYPKINVIKHIGI